MNERQLEIIIRRHPEEFFGPGFELVAQQLSLNSGRIDLLLKDKNGGNHLIELKRGRATSAALKQVMAYAEDFAIEADALVTPWIVAHEIPSELKSEADNLGIRTLATPLKKCLEVCNKFNITPADLIGSRKDDNVLTGGGAKRGLRSIIPNAEVYPTLPQNVSSGLMHLERDRYIDITSGGMQTVIFYKCCKVGGYNRQHRGGQFYVANGVVINKKIQRELINLGFIRKKKTQKGSSHEHIWWEIGADHSKSFLDAVDECRKLIDKTIN